MQDQVYDFQKPKLKKLKPKDKEDEEKKEGEEGADASAKEGQADGPKDG